MRIPTLALLAAALIGNPVPARSELVNGIAVIVNDAVITYQDVMQFIAPGVDLLRSQYRNQPEVLQRKLNEVQRDGTEKLVDRQLILHEFKTAGYVIPESIIDEVLQERIRDRFGTDRVRFAKTLQAEGMTTETFRQQVRENFIIDVLSQKNISSVLIISPYKIETYYERNQDQFKVEDQVKLRMIVLNRTSADDATPERAKEIIAKLEEGASFTEMASVYSEGSQRAQGGDWGWVEKSVLRKELAEAAFSLKPGERSGVIETPEACYVMLVEEARPAHVKPLADVRDAIEKDLLQQEQERLRRKWLDRLRAKSYVRYF